jgi:hypothetical protein
MGDSVRCKTYVAMKNEVLCKILAYNITVWIAEWYQVGLEPVFAEREQRDVPAVLPMAR